MMHARSVRVAVGLERLTTALIAVLGASMTTACGSDAPRAMERGVPGGSPSDRAEQASAEPASNSTAASSSARGGTSTATTQEGDAGASDRPPPLPLTDEDFAETDRTRDPFRSYAREMIPTGPQVVVSESAIKLREYGLDELKLVAVILGVNNPYAMLIDPTGRGTIVRRGEYVGRPETVSGETEGALPHQVPWRLARIVGARVQRDHDGNLAEVPAEVVFEREDRLNPNAARAERVIALAPSTQGNRPQSGGESTQPNSLPPLPNFAPGSSPFLPSFGGRSLTGTSPSSTGAQLPPGTYIQSFTTPAPQQNQPPAAPTVVIQTGPQGETVVRQGGATGQASQQPVPTAPPNPYSPPSGGGIVPPPVRVTGSAPLPAAGLPP